MNVDVDVEKKKKIEVDLRKISQQIIDELAEKTLDEIQTNYSKSKYQAGEEMDFSKIGDENEKIVSMSGPQAWYSEFGTGTEGEQKPHPIKNRFDLKPYNSGETIRIATERVAQKDEAIEAGIGEGDLYWTYQGNDGKVYYTKGIPAQRQVYDAGQKISGEISKVIEKYMKGMS